MKAPSVSEGEWIAIEGVGVANRLAGDPTMPACNLCVTLSNDEKRIPKDFPTKEEEKCNGKMFAASKEMAKLLYRIYMADKTKNNGAIMGEAVLCPHFSNAAHRILLEAGYTDYEPTEQNEATEDN